MEFSQKRIGNMRREKRNKANERIHTNKQQKNNGKCLTQHDDRKNSKIEDYELLKTAK